MKTYTVRWVQQEEYVIDIEAENSYEAREKFWNDECQWENAKETGNIDAEIDIVDVTLSEEKK
jgi:hypothetical protein